MKNDPEISIIPFYDLLLREPDPREEVDGAKKEDDETGENKSKVEVIVARHLIDLKYNI